MRARQKKTQKCQIFDKIHTRFCLQTAIFIIIFFNCTILLAVFHLKLLPSKSYSHHVKEDIYKQCQSVSNRDYSTNISQTIHLILHYSPNENHKDHLYLQVATSYLLHQNLQELSSEQQMHTYITIFLSENYSNNTYVRLKQWFQSIFTPYTMKTEILPLQNNHSSTWKSIVNYIKFNRNIRFETILFFLEDDYIFEIDMLIDTIQLFNKYNLCFVYHTSDVDHCSLNLNDGQVHQILPESNRFWRSISPTMPVTTFISRLRTFLTFEEYLQTNLKISNQEEIFYCSNPAYSAKIENIMFPSDINITIKEEQMAVYYKDWRAMARQAFRQAQQIDTFPCAKINERNLFI